MAFSPLWSCATYPETLANAEIENHFLSVKRANKTGTRPQLANFIAGNYKILKTRINKLVS